ncbi:unnamed protein product, partial [marine sediment metagenome]
IYDGSGSIKIILGKYLASKLLGRKLSEIFFLANAPNIPQPKGFEVLSFQMTMPEHLDVVEAIVDDPSKHCQHDRLIISDGKMRIHYPPSEKVESILSSRYRRLYPGDRDDWWIYKRFVAKALDMKIRMITGRSKIHGIHLLENPIPLYSCEKAELYVGFSTTLKEHKNKLLLEAYPQVYVRESVLDYINYRRSRGASAKGIENTLLDRRSSVVLAPTGHRGYIEELIYKKAGKLKVSELDPRNLTSFWKDVYAIDVGPEETPLLRVRLMKFDVPLT